ncbi:MAG: prenyltransferase [Gammaproteobacteria bacterium]|nr:prenyltransferase [Gammaproteobacteria bacterium]MDH5800678.1 prenyltransferase [Gammaproteobacteria bacterium]
MHTSIPHHSHHHSTIHDYLLATRPHFFIAPLMPLLLGTALAYQQLGTINVSVFLLAILAVVCVNAAVNVYNDVCDEINGSDQANREFIAPFTGGSRVIQEHILSLSQMQYWAAALLLTACVVGGILVFYKGIIVLFFGLAGLLIGLGHSDPRINLAGLGLGEVAVAVAVGILPVVGAAWLQTGQFSGEILLLAVPAGLWVANVLLINSIPDMQADAEHGKRTLAVRYGVKFSAKLYTASNLLALTFVLFAVGNGSLPIVALLFPVLLLPLSFYVSACIRSWYVKAKCMPVAIKSSIGIMIVNLLWLTFCAASMV